MNGLAVLGAFVADMTFVADRLPGIGETIIGSGFSLGPGGKGSNQAVAAARAGAEVRFISKVGRDAFGQIAYRTHAEAGVTPCLTVIDDVPTGSAFVYVNDRTGDNSIIIYPGASGTLSPADVESARVVIESASSFLAQLEQPVDTAVYALRIARECGVRTIFNPSPISAVPSQAFALCDYVVPNEVEAAALVGFELDNLDAARRAGDALIKLGAGTALITLGRRGALYHTKSESVHVEAKSAGEVIDTAGAGDAFLGAFCAGLSAGRGALDAVHFGCAAAAIAVTRRGTVSAMPTLSEIESLLERDASRS